MSSSSPTPITSTALRDAPWTSEEERIRHAYARRDNPSRYSWFNGAHLFGMQEIERGLLSVLRRHHALPLDETRVLEVGCGTGVWLREFIKWGARPHNVYGIDLLDDRIAEARRVCPREVTLECANAAQLRFSDGAFDLVWQSMLFSSVLDDRMRGRIAEEMLRVVSPAGLVVWYDYHVNNPRNRDVRRVTAAEIRRLFPDCFINLRRMTLVAPLARVVAARSTALYRALHAIPLLRTHYLGVIRKRSASR